MGTALPYDIPPSLRSPGPENGNMASWPAAAYFVSALCPELLVFADAASQCGLPSVSKLPTTWSVERISGRSFRPLATSRSRYN